MAPSDLTIQTGQMSPRQKRSQSVSSDRPSLAGSYGGLLSPPSAVSPDPAFIAASAASQIVTNDHDGQADMWFDQHGIEPSGETALVAQPALQLVNRFLDQLLFNFLSVSRSTSLASLRPAVAEVLKPKLAKEAISGADQELHEYLGGGEEEELLAFHNGLEPSGDWDLELVWKRTRLRCMVYSSLGDMEEEDEDLWTEQEQLDGPPGSNNRFSNNPGVVSPAVAIFLTAILEFMGEQVLVVAGQTAYQRLRVKHERDSRSGRHSPAYIADRVVVEETDMERVALDRTLGRLWRGWKKRIRSPTTSISMIRSFSRESMNASMAASIAPDESVVDDNGNDSIAAVLAEHEHAATIPLPLNDDDVREIEIPGLAHQSDDEDDEDDQSSDDEEFFSAPRPKSLLIPDINFMTTSQPHSPLFLVPATRKRSNSLPSAPRPPFRTAKRQKQEEPVEISTEEEELERKAETNDEEVELADEKVETGTEDDKSDDKSGIIAGAIGGAAALGATAVAGIVAAVQGNAPQTALVTDDGEVDEEFSEEPQIMTSSRISIGGRISPDQALDAKAVSRRSSIRSQSVHSLRLIDVAPKSPSRSRTASMDAADYISGRPTNLSRNSSVHSPLGDHIPRMGSPVSRGPNASPIARNGSSMSIKHVRNSAEASITEVEENHIGDSEPNTAVPAELAYAMQGVDVETSPTHQQSSDTANLDVTPSSTPFVLSAAPASRTHREASVQPVEHAQLILPSRSQVSENGAPPLTPLREMMEGAPDTSDDSSNTHTNDARSVGDYGVYGHSPSASESTIPPRSEQRTVRVYSSSSTRNSPPRHREDNRQVFSDPITKTRSIHTSGSGSSSTSNKLKPVRTSQDSAPRENKSQSFEQLIRSDQTIQYTLTPQNMRDIEDPDSPRNAAPMILSNGVDRPMTGRSHSSSVGKYSSLHSNPVIETKKKPFKPIPRPQSNTGARLRPNAPQPREARVDRDSMGDFAEFIRSTGPANPYEPTPLPTRSLSSARRGENDATRNFSNATAASAPLPKRTQSSAGRSRLQARDAAVPRGDSISDLIDFVRSGPQLEKEDHRIPRTVAPFRTTMDSDQMSGAVGGKAIDASLPDPRFSDPRYSQATASVTSSVASTSALLGSRNKPLPVQQVNEFDEEDRMPKRKTRRVKDPYAIDLSDEEDEFEVATRSRPKPIEEESLADFLKNVPPPPEPVTSAFESVQRPASNKNIKKKSSTPSLMSRFGRKDSIPTLPPKRTEAPAVKAPAYTPIAAKYSTTYGRDPSQNNNYADQVSSARSKVVQKSYQPREAVYTSSARTSDLADFLMRSEPPSTTQTEPKTFVPAVQKEEGGAFQRMFGRKKVH